MPVKAMLVKLINTFAICAFAGIVIFLIVTLSTSANISNEFVKNNCAAIYILIATYLVDYICVVACAAIIMKNDWESAISKKRQKSCSLYALITGLLGIGWIAIAMFIYYIKNGNKTSAVQQSAHASSLDSTDSSKETPHSGASKESL